MIHPIHNLIHSNNLDTFDKLKNFIETKFQWSINEAGNLYLIKTNKERLYNELENSLLGTIFEKNTNKVVFYGINNFTNEETIKNKIGDSFAVEEFIDGTQINLYWYNGWRLGTNNKIDAFNSKWGNEKSFGELFEEIVDIKKLELNQHYCYSFILQHIENRIVSPIIENKIWHIESRNLITGEPEYIEIGLEHPRLVYLDEFIDDYIDRLQIDSVEKYEIFRSIEGKRINWDLLIRTLTRVNNEVDFSFPGFIVYSGDRKYRYNIMNGEYMKILEIRQISSDWDYIIIDLWKNKINPFEIFYYYPEKRLRWFQLDTELLIMKYAIYDIYFKTKIEKVYLKMDPYMKSVIYNIHKIYLDRVKSGEKGFKITVDDINKYFSELDTPLLVSIYKKYKNNPIFIS